MEWAKYARLHTLFISLFFFTFHRVENSVQSPVTRRCSIAIRNVLCFRLNLTRLLCFGPEATADYMMKVAYQSPITFPKQRHINTDARARLRSEPRINKSRFPDHTPHCVLDCSKVYAPPGWWLGMLLLLSLMWLRCESTAMRKINAHFHCDNILVFVFIVRSPCYLT